jgi:hypothetical protein
MNPLPIATPATSHPRRHCRQGPLDNTCRSLHRHHRRRPPSPSLYATTARHHHGVGCCLVPPAVTVILILVVQRCRNPTNDGINAASPQFSSPPHRSRALSALLIAHGAILDRHAASTPSGTTRRVPLPPAPPFSKDGTIAPAPLPQPPRCLGLLSGGWC